MTSSHTGGRSHVQSARNTVVCLALLVVATLARAQSPTTVQPQPTPTLPPPSTLPAPGKLPPTGTLTPPAITVNPEVLIGRWIHTRQDTETRTSDSVVIEFKADGSYTAKNRHSLFPTPERPGQGRYAVRNIQGNTFDLRIERSLIDPDTDPNDAIEIQKITVVNRDTLLAADGSTVQRVKE